MRTKPCRDWPLDPDCSFGIEADPSKQSPEECAAVGAASELLWRWTAGVFDLCFMQIRPCRSWCILGEHWRAELVGGTWLNVMCACPVGQRCSCGPICSVELPGPVHNIVDVTVDGVALPEDSYRIDNFNTLVRTDGGCWPECQWMDRPTTEQGTWSVCYFQGLAVPPLGRRALGALAKEFLNICEGKPCRLPSNATTVAREGVTITLDTTALAAEGRTGMAEVDLWVGAVNPNGLRQRSAVYSVDLPPAVLTTWPGWSP